MLRIVRSGNSVNTVGRRAGAPGRWSPAAQLADVGFSRDGIWRSVEESLIRLGMDRVDGEQQQPAEARRQDLAGDQKFCT
jgi:aryl-alcohol dehydrogenase-like predicted oxidoreductase